MNEEVCRDMTGEADGTVLKSRYGRIQCRDLVREGKVFIKDKAKVASRVGCSERRFVILESCCLSLIRRNSVLELRVRRFAVIQEEICCRAFCK